MADYNSGKLNMVTQGVSGRREWQYEDTGPVTDVVADGFVTNAKQKGLVVGDYVRYYDSSRTIWYGLRAKTVQDTGATQGTLDGQVIVGDTS